MTAMKTASAALCALALVGICVSGPAQAAPRQATAPAGKAQADAVADRVLSDLVDRLWKTADVYWHDGDYNRIVGLGRVIVEIDPDFDEAFDSCAWLLWSMGETPAADWFLEYGVKRSPRKGIFYANLGQHLNRTKRYPEAMGYLEKAVQLGGVPPSAYATLGHLYTRAGRLEEAVATWRAVVKLFPQFPAGPKNLKSAEERLAASRGKK